MKRRSQDAQGAGSAADGLPARRPEASCILQGWGLAIGKDDPGMDETVPRRRHFAQGFRYGLPVTLGYLPVSFAFAVCCRSKWDSLAGGGADFHDQFHFRRAGGPVLT